MEKKGAINLTHHKALVLWYIRTNKLRVIFIHNKRKWLLSYKKSWFMTLLWGKMCGFIHYNVQVCDICCDILHKKKKKKIFQVSQLYNIISLNLMHELHYFSFFVHLLSQFYHKFHFDTIFLAWNGLNILLTSLGFHSSYTNVKI